MVHRNFVITSIQKGRFAGWRFANTCQQHFFDHVKFFRYKATEGGFETVYYTFSNLETELELD